MQITYGALFKFYVILLAVIDSVSRLCAASKTGETCDESALPPLLESSCSDFELTFGDPLTANAIVLGELHPEHHLTMQCIDAMIKMIPNFQKGYHFYVEGGNTEDMSTNENFKDDHVCQGALSCKTWEDTRYANEQLKAFSHDKLNLIFAKIEDFLNRSQLSDAKKAKLIQKSLSEETELAIVIEKCSEFLPSRDVKSARGYLLSLLLSEYKENHAKFYRSHPNESFFSFYLQQHFLNVKEKVEPSCAKVSNLELANCNFEARSSKELLIRDASLYKKVLKASKNDKPSVFFVGAVHLYNLHSNLIKKGHNGDGIATLKNKRAGLK